MAMKCDFAAILKVVHQEETGVQLQILHEVPPPSQNVWMEGLDKCFTVHYKVCQFDYVALWWPQANRGLNHV